VAKGEKRDFTIENEEHESRDHRCASGIRRSRDAAYDARPMPATEIIVLAAIARA
jgi:hypothetical protein